MSIAPDQYFTVTPSNFLSKAHCTFGGQDLFFFVTELNELRVQVFNAILSYRLAPDVKQVQILPGVNEVNVYFLSTGGEIFYFPFHQLGTGVTPVTTHIQQIQNFSAFHARNTLPASYLLMVDDGVRHLLYVASDPGFTSVSSHNRVYNNSIDQTYYTFGPRLAIHPQDTRRLTVVCQRQTISTGDINVGMYEIVIPGAV